MTRAQAHTRTGTPNDTDTDARRIIDEMCASVDCGERHWFDALLHAIRQWPLPVEQVGDRTYRYLVGGEAFDWLLLAERLCAEMNGLLPADEQEALLFDEKLPVETTEDDFKQLLGAKYPAHLNFVYGVRVEAALHLAVAEEITKERTATLIWERNGRADDEVFQRIYGKSFQEMSAGFRAALADSDSEWITLGDLSEWRYWLFQYRVKNCDPAKVASDTRKGLVMLQRLERAARRRRAPASAE